ncbi:MAG: pyridoxamine 5'-phosphate oxidase family protein [Nitrospinae bacterium]|nr:pyridoxamine 5'-phosphate oxidase family protein [Nitrospinota bacterium]
MREDIKNKVLSYMKGHLYGNLATIYSDDAEQPHVSSIAYVNNGFDLYFTTSVKTQKFVNMEKNPKIAMTIDEDEPDWMKLNGLQIEGIAEVLKEKLVPAVFEIYADKFPIIKGFPSNPDYRFIKIIPKKMWVIDYKRGLGHRDYLEL